MHHQWSRQTKLFVSGLYAVLIAALLFAARPMLTPILIGVLLAYMLSPLVRLITHRIRVSHNTAVIFTFIVFLVLLVAIPSSFTSLAIRQINLVTNDIDNILAAVEIFVEEPIQISGVVLDAPRETILMLEEEIRSLVRQLSSQAINSLRNIGTNFVWLIIVFVTTFYLMRDGSGFRRSFISRLPGKYRGDASALLHEIDGIWGTYLRGQVILALLIGILTGAVMGLVGLRGALAVGIIAGILDLIPSLGPLVGGAVSVGIALILGSTYFDISNLGFALIVGGIFFLIQQFENIWLAPRILGRRLKLHPAVVVIGVLGALVLTGILGAFVIIPLIASFIIISRYVYAKLLDQDPWPEPQEEDTASTSELSPDVPPAAPEEDE